MRQNFRYNTIGEKNFRGRKLSRRKNYFFSPVYICPFLPNIKLASKSGFNGTWGKSFPMPKNINTTNNEGAPTLSADGRNLVFVACADQTGSYYGENRSGKGSCDLFYAKKIILTKHSFLKFFVVFYI